MKFLMKSVKWLLFLISSLIAFILIFLLTVRLYSPGREDPFLDENGKVLPNSVAVHEDKIICGAPQRITIRGKNIANPVLLVVHGGPGVPLPSVFLRTVHADVEDLFVVCYWEQRGSGHAYYVRKDEIPDVTITLPQIVDDGLEVVKYLKEKFVKDKIYIEGVSWGTTVSAFMVQKNPELFHAYIGIGQMANQPISEQLSFDFVMNQAVKQNDTISINQLSRIGRPPYPNKSNVEMANACSKERMFVRKYAPPRLTLTSMIFLKALLLDRTRTFKEKYARIFNTELNEHAFRVLWPTCFNVNLMRDVPEWKIPVFIIQGDNDHNTETSLAKAYFDSIKAPSKRWFLFKNATHGVQFEYPETYRSIYINEILKN